MSATPVVDLVVNPFTPEMRAGPYSVAPDMRDSLIKLGVFDRSYTSAELVAAMDDAGIDKAIVPAANWNLAAIPYDVVGEMVNQYPDRLFGLAGVDPRRITPGVEQLARGVRDYGFVGAHSFPHWFRLAPDDRAYYPFYAKCVELNIPVQIQAGLAYQRGLRSVGQPSAIDSIAVDFPELQIVAIHTGYPWEREMVAVSWKHPNVYIGADANHPRDWPSEIVEFIRGPGADKVMFGTNAPVLDFADVLEGIAELALPDGSRAGLLGGNANRVFGL